MSLFFCCNQSPENGRSELDSDNVHMNKPQWTEEVYSLSRGWRDETQVSVLKGITFLSCPFSNKLRVVDNIFPLTLTSQWPYWDRLGRKRVRWYRSFMVESRSESRFPRFWSSPLTTALCWFLWSICFWVKAWGLVRVCVTAVSGLVNVDLMHNCMGIRVSLGKKIKWASLWE